MRINIKPINKKIDLVTFLLFTNRTKKGNKIDIVTIVKIVAK